MGNSVEKAVEGAMRFGYDKIINLIFDYVGVPSFMRGPLKKFISTATAGTVDVAVDKLLEAMGEIPQAKPSLCSQLASKLLSLSNFECNVEGLDISVKVSGETKKALFRLIAVLKTKQD